MNKQGVPIPAVLFSALLIFGCVLVAKLLWFQKMPKSLNVCRGGCISPELGHDYIDSSGGFRQAIKQASIQTKFPALWAPVSNYVVLIFIATVLYIMWMQGFKESVLMIPIWIVVMLGLFKVMKLE